MEDQYTNKPQAEGNSNSADCGCSDGSCKPKKKNVLSKILFTVIIMAALAIIVIKIAGNTEKVSGKQLSTSPGKAAVCDTTKGKTCDTTKGSSCCSKK